MRGTRTLLLVALLVGTTSVAQAQQRSPPRQGGASGQPRPTALPTPSALPSPQYGPGWRPPQPGAPVPPGLSSSGSLAPAAGPAASPFPPPAVPSSSGGGAPAAASPRTSTPECGWLLAGTWSVEGEHTGGSFTGQVYRTAVTFRQFGDHLVGTQAEDTITYYGRCSSDDVELEVWIGWDYIGRQRGRVTPDGLAILASWSLWSPEPMEGHETLTGRARRLR